MKQTVYIVDDDRAMRDALAQLLDNAGFRIRAFSEGAEFLAACDADSTGCILLDMSMPGMSGREVQATLQEQEIGLPVLFLTGHGDIPSAVKAVKDGAIDFLEKPIRGEVLIARVQRALEIDAERRKSIAKARDLRQRHARLTDREREVMHWVTSGLSNKEIARKLELSPRTVEAHRQHVMHKMGADNLVELVEMASACVS